MLNKKKNLRSGASVWLDLPFPKIPFEELESDKTADVIIIGSGITGAMAAEEISSAGYKTIIIDRRPPMRGATSATTALLQYELDTPLIKLQKQIGSEKAMRTWRRSKLALESLAAKIQDLNIDCSYARRDSLYLAGNLLDSEDLKLEALARKTIGIHSQYLTRNILADTYNIKRNAALKSFDSLSVNPLRLTAGFLQNAVANGAKIYSPLSVKDVEPSHNSVSVITSEGPVLTAKFVVFATGYEIPKYMKIRRNSIHSTWAIATKKQKSRLWPGQCFIWESSDPYLYIRATPDGRVICGGEDEEFVSEEERNKLIPKKAAILERKLKTIFPHLNTKAEFSWTGSFGASSSGMPTIGPVPNMRHCYGIMAFGGNGITFSRIAAEMVTAHLTGKYDPDEDLFRF